MISLQPLPAPLGASVIGLDSSALVRDDVAAELSQALATHGVLTFPDHQLHIDELAELASLFSGPDTRPQPADELTNVGTGSAAVRRIQRWQSTGSYLQEPPVCTVAMAVEVPERGGQFQVADMRRVLGLLPPEDRAEIAFLHLHHSYQHWVGDGDVPVRVIPDSAAPDRDAPSPDASAEHPWIRHNDDGSQSLFMGAAASHIVGRTPAASRQWFAEIEAQLPVHDVLYEHRWEPNDILVWDHRITMHRMLGFDVENDRCTIQYVTVGHES